MKLAVYVPKEKIRKDPRYLSMMDALSDFEMVRIDSREQLPPDSSMLLSIGGDGTYLSAAEIAVRSGIPILGVNFGRLGFLSDCPPEKVASTLHDGSYIIEEREVLSSSVNGEEPQFSLNEVSVNRYGPSMLGVNVSVNGESLPTYWADGLLVATSSGSTAYSLSVGGPICLPDSRVIILSPIAPHNLNVRPLIIPSSSKLEISFRSRENTVAFARDNRHALVGKCAKISVSVAQFSLKRVRLPEIRFISALTSKLFWGEDVRNESV